MVAFVTPQLAQAQAPIGNNPTTAGIYVEGMVGANLLNDIDLDINTIADDATIKSKVGAFGAAALGYSIPQGPINIRIEGELSIRGNKLDEFEFADGTVLDGDDDAKTNAYAGMVNAHFDYYMIPNFALSVGAGIGYAKVEADTIVDGGAVNLIVFDEESDSALAYQGRLGARYDLNNGGSLTAAYTYFATDDLTIEAANGANESTFNYESHAIGLGFAFRF